MDASVNDLFAKLQSALKGGAETPEEGFKTARQWGAVFGKSHAFTKKLLAAGVKSGVIEVKHYRIRNGMGLRPVSHYREVK